MIKLIINFVLLFVLAFADDDGPVVQTNQGLLRGKYSNTRQGRKISAFLGIPFAKPPIGELRFKPPVPGEPWEGERDATKTHGICPQRNVYTRTSLIEGEEDCLYLNVYTPQLPDANKELLPVMLFFHGGGWLCGGGNNMWYGPDILLDRDVVLVVTNYRLGALGFLTTGDEVVPGNNGMKDQNLAMKWIKNNIAQFGGNPNSVTLFGESAGGVSAQHHMLSPLSKGLFHKAISQSGTSFCTWALAPNDEGVKNSKKLAQLLNCPTSSSQKMVDCLRKIDPLRIIELDKKFMDWDFDPMIPFKPVIEPNIEGAFLTEDPYNIIKSGKFAQIPWLTGINNGEGALRAAAIYGNPHLLEELDSEFNRVVPISLLYDKTCNNLDYVSKLIRKFYFGDKKIDNSTRMDVVNMYTDNWFLFGADQGVQLHAKYSSKPVYYYLFSYRGSTSFSALFGDPHNDYGACHVDELQYIFPVGDGLFPDIPPNENDKKMAEIMTTLWVNFAKTGNPTPDVNNVIKTKWEPVMSEDLEFYSIQNVNDIKMNKNLYLDRVKFWRNLPFDSRRNEIRDEL